MKVAKIMSSDVHIASPNDSVEEIARIMASEDIGFLPVGENDRLIGTITDRDIIIRGVASGKDGDARVPDVTTRELK